MSEQQDKKRVFLYENEIKFILATLRLQEEIISKTDFAEIHGIESGDGMKNNSRKLQNHLMHRTGVTDKDILASI
jgi:hypothetical protein